jgi:serine/threonine-protein kinase
MQPDDESEETGRMTAIGRYEVLGRLGEGAMADVYRAHDPGIGRVVAIKVLKPEYARNAEIGQRFLREARAAGALNHPHIATVHDVGEADGVAYLAMELIEGRPLDAVIEAQGRIPHERVLLLARQLADALGYAHRAGVVHRDVKPSNILLSEDGRTAKLLDFGVARLGDADPASLAKTQVGQLIGTPRYMSPEQALGLPVDGRADLFSLGVVLYEMVTGRVAFAGTSLATLAIQIAQDKVESIDRSTADCPPGLRFIIDKLLCKKPEARFPNGEALVAAIDREIGAAKDVEPTRRGLPLRLKLPLALAAVTAVALGGSVWAIQGRERVALERMAVVSGETIATFVTGNAAVTAADNAGLPPEQQDWSALQAFAATAARDRGVREIVVADAAGVVRASSRPELLGRRYSAPAREARVEGAATPVTVAPDRGAGAGLRLVRPIRYAGAAFGTVDLVLRREALDGALATSRALLTALSVIVTLAVLLVGYLSGAFVAKPLRRLRDALDDAPAAGFGLRISHGRRDEFGAAFDSFNRAAAAVEPQLTGAPVPGEASVLATRIADMPRLAA